MKRATKPKRVRGAKTAIGNEGRKSSRFVKTREGDFEIETDFWREALYVTSPELPKHITFGATLKAYPNTAKNPVVTVWLKPLGEIHDKRLQTKIVHSIKTALNNSGYSVNFK